MVPRILSMYEEQDSTNDQQLKQQLESTLSVFLPLLTPKVSLGSSVPYCILRKVYYIYIYIYEEIMTL